jgi:hypothetical protein
MLPELMRPVPMSSATKPPSNNHEYLKKRHGLFDDLVKNISGFAALIEKALE